MALWFALKAYTACLDNPVPMLYLLVTSHALRVFFSVIYDRHKESMKEVGLITIAALLGVGMASIVRPFALDSLIQLEGEIGDQLHSFHEYFAAIHNKTIGIPGFFVACYILVTKAIRWLGNYVAFLRYPRSSLELFGAFYKAAYDEMSNEEFLKLEGCTRRLIAGTRGRFYNLSSNHLIPTDEDFSPLRSSSPPEDRSWTQERCRNQK